MKSKSAKRSKIKSRRDDRSAPSHSEKSPSRRTGSGGSRAKEPTITRLPQRGKPLTPAEIAKKKAIYLTTMAKTGNIGASCRAARISRSYMVKVWRGEGKFREWTEEQLEEHELFKELEAEARENAIDLLEQEAVRRARDGIDKPIVYQGKVVSTFKEYSDTLMNTLLRAERPSKYRENLNLTNSDGSLAAAFAAAVKGVADEAK